MLGDHICCSEQENTELKEENLMKLIEKTVIESRPSKERKSLKIEKGLKTLSSKDLIENNDY